MVWTEERTTYGVGGLTPLVSVTSSKHEDRWRGTQEELGEGNEYD